MPGEISHDTAGDARHPHTHRNRPIAPNYKRFDYSPSFNTPVDYHHMPQLHYIDQKRVREREKKSDQDSEIETN